MQREGGCGDSARSAYATEPFCCHEGARGGNAGRQNLDLEVINEIPVILLRSVRIGFSEDLRRSLIAGERALH